MSSQPSKAELMFWGTPELVDSLLPFINSDAILDLAKCHDLTLNILQGTQNWMMLIERSCPFPDPAWPFLELDIKTIKNLAGILDDEVKGPRHTFDDIPSPPVAENLPWQCESS